MAVLGWPLRTGRQKTGQDPRAWDRREARGASQQAHSGSLRGPETVSLALLCLATAEPPRLPAASTQKQSQPAGAVAVPLCVCVSGGVS